jgi:hypothetical protein
VRTKGVVPVRVQALEDHGSNEKLSVSLSGNSEQNHRGRDALKGAMHAKSVSNEAR